MQRIFEQLWNGNIAPYKSCGSGDSEVRELNVLMERNRADLAGVLNTEKNALFDKYIACRDEYEYLTAIHAYREGFSLACKLLTEVLR